jgi:ribonucleotide reductase beta subunit family protein with ferritin-like domain
MPRKRSDENLTKVVSSIISVEDFGTLEKYAKVYYTHNQLKLPTISHIVRYILSDWANQMRKMEQQPIRNRKLNQPGLDKLSTAGIDPAYLDRVVRPHKP